MTAISIPPQTISVTAQLILAACGAVMLTLLGAIVTYLFAQTRTNRDMMTFLQVTTATLSANHTNLVSDVSEMKIDVKGIRAAVEEYAREGSAVAVLVAQQGEKIRQLRCQRDVDAAHT